MQRWQCPIYIDTLNLIKNVEDDVVFLFEKCLILIYYQLVFEPEKRKAKGI